VKIALLITVAGLLLTAAKWAYFPFIPHRNLPRHRVRYLRLRLRLRLHPGGGHATVGELWLRWGRFAMFRHSNRTRPGLTVWQRMAVTTSAYSIFLGRAHYQHALRLPLDEHTTVTSPPRGGKTGWLASVILRYPGPVVSTTTKHDVFALTSGVRAMLGPVHVFNPQSVGDVPSTFRWNPVEGCDDPATAIRRADAFAYSVSQQGVEEGTFWASKASDYLRAYFHAGALAGLDLTDVARWVSGLDSTDAESILVASGTPTGWQWASQLAELRGHADRTAQTIRMTMSRALAFLADPALASSVTAVPGQNFQIENFLEQSGTLYLIAETRGEDSPVAPLFACLANEIHFTAALIGSRQPADRLDPPLLMALDEVTQICPVPVPSWLADSGGKGIQIMTVAHGEAQLRQRWGHDGARIITDTTGARIWLPGITDPDALDTASMLCGTAAMREHGEQWTSRHPIMTPDMIRQLPAGRALVIRGGYSPVIAKLRMAWNDPLYRHARQRHQAVAAVVPAIEPAPGGTLTLDRPPAWPTRDGLRDRFADEHTGDYPPVQDAPYPWDQVPGSWDEEVWNGDRSQQ
jgi:type IV secretion system protein VirD4